MPKAKLVDAKKAFVKDKSTNPKATGMELKMVNTRLPREIVRQMKIVCATKEIKISDFIAGAITDKLKKY